VKYAITFLIVLFIFAAFFGKLSYAIDNPFLAYVFYVLNLSVKFFPIILLIFSIISIYFIWRHYKHNHPKRKTFHSFFQIFEIIFISIFSAFVILFIIGFIQLNVYSLLLNKDPAVLGVKTNTQDIYNAISENNIAPIIMTTDDNSKNIITALAKASSGSNNFYGEIVLSNVPKLLIFPLRNDLSSLLFLDNTLVISEIKLEDIEKISPLIGYQILQNYFPQRKIKSYPVVSVMDEEEYFIFRKEDAKEKLEKINTEIENIDSSISSLSAQITLSENEITLSEENKRSILEERDDEYNNCLSEGTYSDDNTFIPANSRTECQTILERWEEIFVFEENRGKELLTKLNEDQEKLRVYEFYETFFSAQGELSDISAQSIPSELGVFIPENILKVVLLNNNSESIADYLSSLTHEYLHYASYIPGKRLESSFFEEGLTEYFARQAIKTSLNKNTDVGYPILIMVLEQILNRIPEEDFENIYFNKDQLLLEDTLDKVYGENFYNDNIVYLESLLYTSNKEQILGLANTVIKNINGVELRKEDI
jgi:hypothetical protein